jgi:hypothetical protein
MNGQRLIFSTELSTLTINALTAKHLDRVLHVFTHTISRSALKDIHIQIEPALLDFPH